MHKITGSSLVCIFFESRNYWYVLVHTSTSQYIQVCTCLYLYVLVHTSTYTYDPVHTGMYLSVLVCTITYWKVNIRNSMNQYILLMTGLSQYELGCTRMYWYILAYFLNSGVLSYLLVLFWIRGGTRRYKAVPESPVPLDMQVQGTT